MPDGYMAADEAGNMTTNWEAVVVQIYDELSASVKKITETSEFLEILGTAGEFVTDYDQELLASHIVAAGEGLSKALDIQRRWRSIHRFHEHADRRARMIRPSQEGVRHADPDGPAATD